MTFRSRMADRPRRRSLTDSEDRFQLFVTIGFVAVIVAVILILVAAVGLNYYNAHFRPIATVDGRQITQDDWSERIRLTVHRIQEARNQARAALAAGRIDEATWQQREQALQQAESGAPNQAIQDLINLNFQANLAAAEGVTVSDDELAAAIEREASIPEQRRVQAIFVEPETDEPGAEPTAEQDAAARMKAEGAVADLAAGFPFAQVAQQSSTDISGETGGEYGYVTMENGTDDAWIVALFALGEGDTTEIIKGTDGVYRIGRVTEIIPASRNAAFEEELAAVIPLDAYRADARMEEAARRLRELIADRAVSEEVEQLHLAEILVAQTENEDPASTEGTVHASHILYSPNSDPGAAKELPGEDPAWAAAQMEAQLEAARLTAIQDPEARAEAFAESAEANTDDVREGDDGGDLGFFSRTMPYVVELTAPLFDNPLLAAGDIVGPLQTEFGFHVVLFQERRPPTAERIAEVRERLAEPEAEFAAIARELSDGATAADGGDLGWVIREQLPTEVVDELFALEVGATSQGAELADGFHVYRLLERGPRPLDEDQRGLLEGTAFDTWYAQRLNEAMEAGRITRDESILGTPNPETETDTTLQP